jgi:pSer/pThr/pTyr-binding forkhead associated (FHA) protein
MTRLTMRRGPQPGKVFELNSDIVTVGSGAKNQIIIQDNDISRDHCRLIRVMADYELQDLNSTRGTFVSGQRVTDRWLLKPGSFIELGENVTLEYERGSAGVELESMPARPPVAHTEQPALDANPSFVMTVGPKPGEVFALTTPVINIGRDLTNNIVIHDPEISRFHIIMRWADTSYTVEDNTSTNGTTVNGMALPPKVPRILHANDVVLIATTVELRYTWQPNDVKIEPPEPAGVKPKISTKEIKLIQQDAADTNLFAKSKRQTSKLGTGLNPGALVDHVFVAYAREEWESFVAPLTIIMQDAGLKVWVDQYLTQGGDDWMLAVEQALSECGILLVVISPESLNSRYVRLAYRYFFNREKPIIPLLYAGVEDLPPELKNVNVIRYNSTDRKKTFDELVADVKAAQK